MTTDEVTGLRRSARVQKRQAEGAQESDPKRIKTSLTDGTLYESQIPYTGSTRTRNSKARRQRKVMEQSDLEFPVLRRLDLYAGEINGDGNCLFRALGDQLYGDGGKCHTKLRKQTVDYIKTNEDRFKPFVGDENWADYLKRMAKGGVYGDNVEIVAFADCFECNVVIYQRETLYVVSATRIETNTNLHIAYHEWEHYSSVRNKAGPHSGIPEVKPREDPLGRLASDSNVAPEWKVELVQKSLPHYMAADLVAKELYKNNGDFGTTVEQLLEADMAENGEMEEPKKEEQEQQKDDQETKKEEPPKAKPKMKLTAREKKERQKKQAQERKREQKAKGAFKTVQEKSSDETKSSTNGDIKTMYI